MIFISSILISFQVEKIILGHSVPNKVATVLDIMDNFKFGFEMICYYLTCYTTIGIFSLLLSYLVNKLKNNESNKKTKKSIFFEKLIFLILFFKRNRRKNFIFRIFLLFFGVFYWHTQLFVVNTIKTNKVVVDLDDLITDFPDILKTTKVNCFVEDVSLI